MHAVVDKAAADRATSGERRQGGRPSTELHGRKVVEALGAKPLAADLAAIRAELTRSATSLA